MDRLIRPLVRWKLVAAVAVPLSLVVLGLLSDVPVLVIGAFLSVGLAVGTVYLSFRYAERTA